MASPSFNASLPEGALEVLTGYSYFTDGVSEIIGYGHTKKILFGTLSGIGLMPTQGKRIVYVVSHGARNDKINIETNFDRFANASGSELVALLESSGIDFRSVEAVVTVGCVSDGLAYDLRGALQEYDLLTMGFEGALDDEWITDFVRMDSRVYGRAIIFGEGTELAVDLDKLREVDQQTPAGRLAQRFLSMYDASYVQQHPLVQRKSIKSGGSDTQEVRSQRLFRRAPSPLSL